MIDSLGHRRKFGVIAPSTNTTVQPEFDAMRPRGVTNHFGRIAIPNDPVHDDDDFNRLMDNIRRSMMQAVDDVMTCEPDYLIMGMSSETFWDGLEGSKRLHQRVEARAGVRVAGAAGTASPGPSPPAGRARSAREARAACARREPGTGCPRASLP